LNMRTYPDIFSDVPGYFNVGAKIEIIEVVEVTEIIFNFSTMEDELWHNVYGKVGKGLYVPLFYKNVYYTSWRKP
jgi:hypothetical protein